jgi:predicted DNA-binding transcriptional regulator YafY/transposase
MKRDRTARLLRLQLLLWQHPEGLELKNIALLCSINVRTVYRDLHALETEIGVPIWQQGKKRGVMEGYFLPPITLNVSEAMVVFFLARLMYNHVHLHNPDLISLIMQLGTIVPQPLRTQIQNTINHIEKLPRNDWKFNNFTRLTNAWLSHHPVTIQYKELVEQEPIEYRIDPYFIEPNITRHFSYIYGYCHSKQQIMSFRIDCIVGDVAVDNASTFEVPEDFDVINFHSFGWGNCDFRKTETIKLKFRPEVNKSILETVWQPTQKIEAQEDGSWTMTFKAENCVDFFTWILAQGLDVEVLEPDELRQQMLNHFRVLTELYSRHQRKENEQSNAILLSSSIRNETLNEQRKLLKADKIEAIRRAVMVEGRSIRSVAKQMGVSRNTAAKYVRESKTVKATRKPRTAPVRERILPRLDELLKPSENQNGIKMPSGARLHRQLTEEGYRVGVTTVREYLRRKKLEGKNSPESS